MVTHLNYRDAILTWVSIIRIVIIALTSSLPNSCFIKIYFSFSQLLVPMSSKGTSNWRRKSPHLKKILRQWYLSRKMNSLSNSPSGSVNKPNWSNSLKPKRKISKSHSRCLKIIQNVSFEFLISHCSIKIDLSGNTFWPKALCFQKFVKLAVVGIFHTSLDMLNETFSVILKHRDYFHIFFQLR